MSSQGDGLVNDGFGRLGYLVDQVVIQRFLGGQSSSRHREFSSNLQPADADKTAQAAGGSVQPNSYFGEAKLGGRGGDDDIAIQSLVFKANSETFGS